MLYVKAPPLGSGWLCSVHPNSNETYYEALRDQGKDRAKQKEPELKET